MSFLVADKLYAFLGLLPATSQHIDLRASCILGKQYVKGQVNLKCKLFMVQLAILELFYGRFQTCFTTKKICFYNGNFRLKSTYTLRYGMSVSYLPCKVHVSSLFLGLT